MSEASSSAASAGLGFGAALAMTMSWGWHHSIVEALIHGVLGWIYVVYCAIVT